MVDLSKQSVHPPLLPAVVFTDAHFGVITQLVTEEYLCYVTGRGGTSGGKFRISLALPVGAVINCADNTGIVLLMPRFFGLGKSYLRDRKSEIPRLE